MNVDGTVDPAEKGRKQSREAAVKIGHGVQTGTDESRGLLPESTGEARTGERQQAREEEGEVRIQVRPRAVSSESSALNMHGHATCFCS